MRVLSRCLCLSVFIHSLTHTHTHTCHVPRALSVAVWQRTVHATFHVADSVCACSLPFPQKQIQPKSKGATKTLAAYAAKMVAAVPQPAVLTIDSNCSSAESAQLFGSEIVTSSPTQSMSCVPDAKDGAVSTSKHRGLIHGQTYDQRKVLKTVSSLKDRIVGSKDGVMGNGAIHPDLGGMKTLPASDWPSDHALVWSTYTVG